MTVSYNDSFWRALLRWRGSVWKMIWKKLLTFLLLYYALNLSYRFLMTDEQQKRFEDIVHYCERKTSYIPLSLLLGFFVKEILSRWYRQFDAIHWPDKLCIKLLPYLNGMEESQIMIRRTLVRWFLCTCVLAWRQVSTCVRFRFPTIQHLVSAGLLNQEEFELISAVPQDFYIWHVPLAWCLNLARSLELQEKICKYGLREIMYECERLRDSCQRLINYDWLSVPLVYSQVAAIATYGYFAICLVGHQVLLEDKHDENRRDDVVDHYVPVFTVIQFIFFMGWLEVGQDLLRPFGKDDDDFEFNYLLDRHTQVCFSWVDQLAGQLPKLQKDAFWGDNRPLMPYTNTTLMWPDVNPGFSCNIPPNDMKRANKPSDLIWDRDEIQTLTDKNTRSCRCCGLPGFVPGVWSSTKDLINPSNSVHNENPEKHHNNSNTNQTSINVPMPLLRHIDSPDNNSETSARRPLSMKRPKSETTPLEEL